MEKEFVPYEQALALKEIGFNEYCFAIIHSGGGLKPQTQSVLRQNSELVNYLVTSPTFSQAFRWFREKYQKNIVIFSDGFQWTFDLRWVDEDSFDKYPTVQFPRREVGREMFDTYEDAELKCLKKLIEIVKEK